MKIDKVVFIKNRVWIMSVVVINNTKCAFWSSHNRIGVSNVNAPAYFENAHYKEVLSLVKEKLQNDGKEAIGNKIIELQN